MPNDAEFDLDRYLRASGRIDLSGVEWSAVPRHQLDGAEARCLAYMMDIESHTVIFLRDLLATRAALQPDVTAFLSCWVYEELWHGEAFSRFLGEAGFTLAPDREAVVADSPYPTKTSRNAWIRRTLASSSAVGHFATMAGSALVGDDFVAVHMTWGALNELSTLTGYHALIERTGHPVLVQLLRAIIKDERRHFAFYRAQARLRLARSARAQRITRWAMQHLWAPVGTGVRPQEETDLVVVTLFGDDRGARRLEELDATIRELPGLEDTSLATDARRAALARMTRRRAALLAGDDQLARAGLFRAPRDHRPADDVAASFVTTASAA